MISRNDLKTPLQLYLDHHHLTMPEVARTASVRLVTVWSACRGQPVTLAHAAAIRNALLRLTGEPYWGDITVGTATAGVQPASGEQRSRSLR